MHDTFLPTWIYSYNYPLPPKIYNKMADLFQGGGKVEGRDATPTKFFSFDSFNMKSISNVLMIVKLAKI